MVAGARSQSTEPMAASRSRREEATVTTLDSELQTQGRQPLQPPDDAAEPEVQDGEESQVLSYRKPLEVPLVYAEIEPLAWASDEHMDKALRCVTVMANITLPETVSVTIASCTESGTRDRKGYKGMVFFDLTPTDALALADELRLAAENAVVP